MYYILQRINQRFFKILFELSGPEIFLGGFQSTVHSKIDFLHFPPRHQNASNDIIKDPTPTHNYAKRYF